MKRSSSPLKSPIVLDSPAEGAIAAVVVIDRIVEPGRVLDIAIFPPKFHRVRIIWILELGEVRFTAIALAFEPLVNCGTVDTTATLVGIIGNAR